MKLPFKDKIKRELIRALLIIGSLFPLSYIRRLGRVVGVMMLAFSPRLRKRIKDNLLKTQMCDVSQVNELSRATAENLGMLFLETLFISWQRSKRYNFYLCSKTNGFEEVEKVCNANSPVLFLTPHVGNFEIILKRTAYLLKTKKFTVLYKPDKNKWWNELMVDGRTENNIVPVPTTKAGIAGILKALKNGEIVGVLPDSIASQGDGVWTEFFDNRVFATTLAAKLSLMPNVKTFIVACYRNKNGFEANYIPFSATCRDVTTTVQEIYHILEEIVKKHPEQFYWSYDRFRVPDHAKDR